MELSTFGSSFLKSFMRAWTILLLLFQFYFFGCRPSWQPEPSDPIQKIRDDIKRLHYLVDLQEVTIYFKKLKDRWPKDSAEILAEIPASEQDIWKVLHQTFQNSNSITFQYVLNDSLPVSYNHKIEYTDSTSGSTINENQIFLESYFDPKRDFTDLGKGTITIIQFNDSIFHVRHQFIGGKFFNKFIWKAKKVHTD